MQTTWKSFSSLDEAISGTRGNTQLSFGLVRENLFVGESVEWAATAAMNDFGDWQDGSVVLTDQRIFAAYADPSLQQTYGNMVERVPAPRISEYQGGGDLATFAIEGLPIQSIALDPQHLDQLRELLSATDAPQMGNAVFGAVSEDPVEILSKLKKMLDAELISQEEYDAKKAEVLSRM